MDIDEILKSAPSYWDTNYHLGGRLYHTQIIHECDKEYNNVESLLNKAGLAQNLNIRQIKRIQSVYDFAQFKIRSQLKVMDNPLYNFYEVRLFIVVPTLVTENMALYNLDVRRLNSHLITTLKVNQWKSTVISPFLKLTKTLDQVISEDEAIFVVKTRVSNPLQNVVFVNHSNDYFIEYVVYF